MSTPCGKCTNCPCGVSGSIATTGTPQQPRSQPPPPPPQQQPPEDLSYPQMPPQQRQSEYQSDQYQQQLYQQQPRYQSTLQPQEARYQSTLQPQEPRYQSTLQPQDSTQIQEARYLPVAQSPPPPGQPQQPGTGGGGCHGYCQRFQGQYPPEQCLTDAAPRSTGYRQDPAFRQDPSFVQYQSAPSPQAVRQTYPMAQSPPQYAAGQLSPQYPQAQSTPQYSPPPLPREQSYVAPQQVGGYDQPMSQPELQPGQKQTEVASCVLPTTKVQKRKNATMSCNCGKNRTRNTKIGPGGRKRPVAATGATQPEEDDLPVADTYTCTRPQRKPDSLQDGPGMVAGVPELRCNCHEKKKVDCFCKTPVKPIAKEAPPPARELTHAYVGCGQPYSGPPTYQGNGRGKCGHCSHKKKCAIQ
ncbi:GL21639 [Drosophila persimilis]|uniref:GL21639 n=1 Tax=Drosophila persimilis TaxID=7234 RepID=B4GFD4_DROPE|nr:altered inheritance of mitochondria protein 3 [Drosophila persimilis]EDW34319.1 GL21639 [Drosophila persimilis]